MTIAILYESRTLSRLLSFDDSHSARILQRLPCRLFFSLTAKKGGSIEIFVSAAFSNVVANVF